MTPSPPAVALACAFLLAAALAVPAAAHDELARTRRALEHETIRHPDDAQRWRVRAELARLDGDFAAAADALARAAAIDPGSPALALCRAALLADLGDPGAAGRAAAGALGAGATGDEIARAHLFLARAAAAAGRDAEALAAYARAFADAPHPRADVALERATFALRGGRLDEAAAGLDDALARLPHDRALAETRAAIGLPPVARIPAGARTPARDGSPSDRVAAVIPLLPRFSTWRYSATGAEPAGWAAPGYDDSAWPAGPGVLGFGDPFIVTPVPMGPNATTRYTTTYFRTSFEAVDPGSFTGLTLLANYDDGFLARLNGQEIARRSLPAGPIGYAQFATSHEGGSWESIDVSAFRALLVPGANVLAVEVHQATSTSSDLAWDGELLATDGSAGITRGPYLQNAAPGAMTVRWRTNVATDSRVWIGNAPGALAVAGAQPTPTTEHELRVTGLTPGARSFYAVGSSAGPLAGGDSAHAFTTPPAPGDPATTRVWVLGDSGIPGGAQNRVRDAYAAYSATTPTDVWLMLGDNAYSTGTDAEYQAGLFTPYASFLRGHCLWSTRGNHDAIHSGGANDYYDLFTFPTAGEAGGLASSTEAWYSFDHGDVHFVCLDSEGSSRAPGSPMLTWLAADLAATDRRWVIAFWHHPPYTKGSHDSDNDADSGGRMRDMRQNALPLLESSGVDLVLCGHSHSYERSYLVNGHYGPSGTLLPSMILDGGDGSPAGDGAYHKPSPGPAPNEGGVVAVAGSSAQVSGGTLDHPVMFRSLNVLGSLVLDVAGPELRAAFLDDLGAVRDSFVLRKGEVVAVDPPATRAAGPRLVVAGPNPARGGVRLSLDLPHAGAPGISILDAAGRRVRDLSDGTAGAGVQAVAWDGNDESGRRAPAGLYFAVLDFAGTRRVARFVLLP